MTSANESVTDLEFEIYNPSSYKYLDFENSAFYFDKSLVNYIEKANINLQIERGKSNNLKQVSDSPDKTCFYGKPDKVFQLDKYIIIPTVKELIIDLLPMISTRKNGNKTQVVISGMNPRCKFIKVLGYNPLLIVDGVMNLITRKGNCDVDFSSFSTRSTYPFMESDKHFIVPDYLIPAEHNSRTPDFRTPLYWNPKVILDKKSNDPEINDCKKWFSRSFNIHW